MVRVGRWDFWVRNAAGGWGGGLAVFGGVGVGRNRGGRREGGEGAIECGLVVGCVGGREGTGGRSTSYSRLLVLLEIVVYKA